MRLTSMHWRIAGAATLCGLLWASLYGASQAQNDSTAGTNVSAVTQVLSRPTDHSIGVNILAPTELEAYVEYGTAPGKYSGKTDLTTSKAKVPLQMEVTQLKANSEYFYRLRYREPGGKTFLASDEHRFHTARPAGSNFVFDVQADSHPERNGRMFIAELYERTMENVKKDRPDFFVSLGDDFSIDRGIQGVVTAEKVNQVYINQRQYLGVSGAAAPIFLVNGSHEQAQRYLLDGTPNNPAVWAGNARNRYYSQPAPDGFYTGDTEPVEFIGMIRDYYAWTWGDALFVTIDPYWHSKNLIGPGFLPESGVKSAQQGGGGGEKGGGKKGGGKKGGFDGDPDGAGDGGRDQWEITLGETQYRWLQQTLSQSKAKYKFVFSHHVLGTGRGAVEMADLWEWGGKNTRGEWEFDKKRPGWELPIHQLMVKYGVSVFFQGHDHIFVRQAKDGIVYQEVPNPANPNNGKEQTDFRPYYKSGDYLPASGHLRVSVSPQNAKVDYIWSWMPQDVSPEHKQGGIAFTYDVKPR
jgi:Calcineurin-like phosphoesterase